MRTIDKINDQEILVAETKQKHKESRAELLELKYKLLLELYNIKAGDLVTNDGVKYEVTGITYWKDYEKRPVLAGKVVLSTGVVNRIVSTGKYWRKL